jgi:hypothetical protein
MADTLSSDDAERLKQVLKEQEELMKALNKQYKFSLEFAMKNAMSKRHEKDVIDQFTKSMKLLSGDTLGKFTKGIKEGFASVSDFSEDIRTLDTAISKATDAAEKSALETQRETMARKASSVAMTAAALDFTKALGKNVIGGLAATTGKFVTGLQSNASATELSSTLMSGAVDMMSGTATAAGQGMSKMGDTAMSLAKPGSKLQLMGAAASLAGSALGGLAEGAGKLAKFGIEVLSKEVEKTVTSYNNMSNAGALFADGMTGMRQAANGAGLTVEQFSKVVVANTDALAGSGLGVGEASRKMGAVSEEMGKTVGSSGKSLRRELLQLGVSFEEQAALSAEVMADMRRGRSSQLGDNQAIAQQTAEYAGSLKTIAAITGEDAKSKMAEQRRAATQVAFRLKLQELEQKQPGITQKMLASMTTMDETSRTALMQQMTIGAVVDKSANIMMSGSEAYGEKIMGMAGLAESGQFTAEKAQMIQAEANDKMQGDLKNFREIGIAGMTGSLQDLNGAISGQIANMDKITVSAVESSQRLVEQQKSTTDTLTTQTMAAADAAQNLKTSLEKTLTPAIAQFATVSAEMLGAVQKQLAELGLGGKGGGAEEKSWFGKTWDWVKEKKAISTATGVLGSGAMIAGAGASATGVGAIGGIPLATIGAVLSGVSMLAGAAGLAEGGVVSGPEEGFLTKLHGSEAVIPLGDGRAVPVDLSGFGPMLVEAMESTKGTAVTAVSPAMAGTGVSGTGAGPDDMAQQHLSVLQEIKDTLSASRDLQQQYVYNTYN